MPYVLPLSICRWPPCVTLGWYARGFLQNLQLINNSMSLVAWCWTAAAHHPAPCAPRRKCLFDKFVTFFLMGPDLFIQSALSFDPMQACDLGRDWDFLLLWLKSGFCSPDLEFGVFTIQVRPNWLSDYFIWVGCYNYLNILENSECAIIPWDVNSSYPSALFANIRLLPTRYLHYC